MIKPGEIDKIAHKQGVRSSQIAKDYAISWMLWGISQTPFLKNILAFKGGTCLKKVYFEGYRYSEDLDFTLCNDGVPDESLMANFIAVCQRIFLASRLQFTVLAGSFEVHESTKSIKFRLEYKGPHGGTDSLKVDITRGERLVFEPEERPIFHSYSDAEPEFGLLVYGLKEILVEKAVALMGRTVPRDLYDFHFLTEREGLGLEGIYIEFTTKAMHKGHDPKSFLGKVLAKESTYKRDWENSLAAQIRKQDFPEFKTVWRECTTSFKRLAALLGT
jgi:predicted nucleotidyltransferase component of viral defense system